MKRLLAALAATAFLCALEGDSGLDAMAQDGPVCMPVQDALATALEKFNELPAYVMVDERGGVLILTTNPETHSWSLWVQGDPTTACLVGTGYDFGPAPQSVIDGVRKPGEDA